MKLFFICWSVRNMYRITQIRKIRGTVIRRHITDFIFKVLTVNVLGNNAIIAKGI